ncbi:hypothetical protein Tco_0417902 [Tanacetum coccineum]
MTKLKNHSILLRYVTRLCDRRWEWMGRTLTTADRNSTYNNRQTMVVIKLAPFESHFYAEKSRFTCCAEVGDARSPVQELVSMKHTRKIVPNKAPELQLLMDFAKRVTPMKLRPQSISHHQSLIGHQEGPEFTWEREILVPRKVSAPLQQEHTLEKRLHLRA